MWSKFTGRVNRYGGTQDKKRPSARQINRYMVRRNTFRFLISTFHEPKRISGNIVTDLYTQSMLLFGDLKSHLLRLFYYMHAKV